MLVLFDHSTPSPPRHELNAHVVVEAIERGWERFGNGALLDAAEAAGFDILVTADKTCGISRTCQAGKSPSSFLPMLNGPSCVATLTEWLQP
jgi:hypothetical protein